MSRIRFINLPEPNKEEVVCREAIHHYLEGKRILIHTRNEEQSARIDQLLWESDQKSFIPHATFPCDESCQPIIIDFQEYPYKNVDVLLLASESHLEYMKQFPLIVDFAETYDIERREASRERFRRWKQAGYSPEFDRS